MNLKLVLIASAVAAVGMAMGQGAAGGTKPTQGGKGMMMRQGGGPGGMRRQMPSAADRVKQMTKMLNLTPAQQKKLLPIYEASGKKFKALMEDKKMNEQQKRDAMKKMRDENRKKISAILTKEQLKKMDDMRKQMRMGGGRGPGGPGGAPGGKKGGPPSLMSPNSPGMKKVKG